MAAIEKNVNDCNVLTGLWRVAAGFALLIASVHTPAVLAGGFFETGSVTLNGTVTSSLDPDWQTVTLSRTYVNPVVIAGPITHNNGHTLTPRVQVVAGLIQIGMQSPCDSTGTYAGPNGADPPAQAVCPPAAGWAAETVNYLVMEEGVWEFPDGHEVEADFLSTNVVRAGIGGANNNRFTVNYTHTYPGTSTMTVLHTVNTFADANYIATTASSFNSNANPPGLTNFSLVLEGMEVTTTHGTESIGWIAQPTFSGTNSTSQYSVARTPSRTIDRHQDGCYVLPYAAVTGPNTVSSHNSMSGGNGGALRLCGAGIANAQVNIHLDEDQVRDSERTGIPEFASAFAYSANQFGALDFLKATLAVADDNGGALFLGDTLTYTGTITNVLDDFAQANNGTPELAIPVPAGLQVVSGSLSAGLSLNGTTIEWNGSVAAAATANFSFQLELLPASTGLCATTVSLQGTLNMDPNGDGINSIPELSDDSSRDDGADSDQDILTADDDTTIIGPVNCDADLSIDKDDGSATYTPGSTATYTIVVSNAGPAGVIGATVADTLPAGVSNNGNWNCDANTAPATGTGSCVTGQPAGTNASGSGNINQSIDLPAGAVVVFSLPVSYSADAGDY